MRPMTMAEKVIARTAGKTEVQPGDIVWAVPDQVMIYDFPGHTTIWADAVREVRPEGCLLADRTTIFIDHFVPSPSPEVTEEHAKNRTWAKEQGFKFSEGKGLSLQVGAEMGLAKPGELIAHIDSHAFGFGALGALTFGLQTDVFSALALGKVWLEVPRTIQVRLTGSFKPGVDGRDLIHKIIQDHGGDWAHGCCLEFGGPGALNMSIDQRMATMIMLVFTGALTGAFQYDAVVEEYLAKRGITGFKAEFSDKDAKIKEVVEYDLSEIEPMIVTPGSPSNVVPIEASIESHLDQGYICTCASGRLEDLAVAAKILAGKKIKENFKLYVVPSSKEVFVNALEEGYIQTLIEAGAFISSSSCDYCNGKTAALMPGQTAISTATLNVPGRMGSVDANIYLANVATVAASAIYGKISDPRNLLQERGE